MILEHFPDSVHVFSCDHCLTPILEVKLSKKGNSGFTILHGQIGAKLFCRQCFDLIGDGLLLYKPPDKNA